VNFSIKKGR